MTEKRPPIPAICPMCGGENEFDPSDLVPVESESRWAELDTLLRGTCRTCGEPIDVRVPAETGPLAATGRTTGRWEAGIAFAVLAALLLIFLAAVLMMNSP